MYQDSLKVFNDFRDFVSKMQVPVIEPSKFKKDAIKLIESLKFIKINLEFIGYVVENKINLDIYACEYDFERGVIRDFNGTSLHVNAYHNKEEVCALYDSAKEHIQMQNYQAEMQLRKLKGSL